MNQDSNEESSPQSKLIRRVSERLAKHSDWDLMQEGVITLQDLALRSTSPIVGDKAQFGKDMRTVLTDEEGMLLPMWEPMVHTLREEMIGPSIEALTVALIRVGAFALLLKRTTERGKEDSDKAGREPTVATSG
jgi:hypothetical protein